MSNKIKTFLKGCSSQVDNESLKSKGQRKRTTAFLLACLMLITAIVPYVYNQFDALAETVRVVGRKQWTYGGKTRYEWMGSDGIMYFCAEPGVRNSNPGRKTEHSPGSANGIYGSLELHCKVAAMGYCFNNNLVNYSQAQIYLWNGYSGNAVIDSYAAQFLAEQSGTSAGGFSLPQHIYQTPEQANADPIEIKLVNGTEYVAEILLTSEQEDVLSDPGTVFSIEGYPNFTKTIENGRLKVTFPGGQVPSFSSPMTIIPSDNMRAKYSLSGGTPVVYYIYQEGQDFITGNYTMLPATYYLDFATDPSPEQVTDSGYSSTLHEEVFQSTYNIDLYKYDYETGKELEGSEWNILESFDDSQDGIGDGHNGTVSLELMSPQESSWSGYHTCAMNMRTDSGGHLKHTDERFYYYAKSYCTGHPEPEESGDEEDDDSAHDEWEAEVAACEAATSFHSIEPGEGYAAMIADRDATYEAFINLEYNYTVQESNARTGYSKHDLHADDVRIPVVTLASSESGRTQVWAHDYSDTIISTGIYTPKYKDLSVGIGDNDSDDDDYDGETEYFITDAIVLAISDSGKTIKVDNDGEILTFDISKASVDYDGLSKIEVGCYVDINYVEQSGEKHKAIDVYVYGDMQPEYRTVSGYVKSVSGKKMVIEPDDGSSPTQYDFTEAYKRDDVYNDYTSSKKPAVGSYILEMEYIYKGDGYQTVSYCEFVPKKYLADAGVLLMPLIQTESTFFTTEELLNKTYELESEDTFENETGFAMEDETNDKDSGESLETTTKLKRTKTATTSNANLTFQDSNFNKVGIANQDDDFIFESDDLMDDVNDDDFDISVATSSDAVMMTYTADGDYSESNSDAYPSSIVRKNKFFATLGVSGENVNADLSQYSSKESSPKASAPHNSNTILMTWKIYDHRFEGEIHINKRDLMLHESEQNNPDFDAYAIAQGDGTLEGAVYGLFAAEEVIHPDGKTGVVFNAHDLISVATTDRNGDASFMVITEAPGTTVDSNGNIVPSQTSSTNIFNMNGYRDDYTDDNNAGRLYSDNVNQNGNAWIGRPLICGEHTYYIKELSRSEGYELSVSGKSKEDTNYGAGSDVIDFNLSGKAKFNPAPYFNNQVGSNTKLDPASVEFSVESIDIKNGYTLTTKKYVEGTKFYFVTHNYSNEDLVIEVGTKEVPVTDKNGNPVYKTYNAGDIKYDANGNPIYLIRTTSETEVRDNNGNLSVIAGMTAAESAKYLFKDGTGAITNDVAQGATTVPRIRKNQYTSSGPVSVAIDPTKPLGHFPTIHAAAMEILTGKPDNSTPGLGYLVTANDGSFTTITLSGTTNQEFVNQIVDWYVQHPMWNAAEVEDVYLDTDGKYKAIIIYDYAEIVNGNIKYFTWLYEERTGDLYYCAKYPVEGRTGIDRGTYRTYVKFSSSEITPVYGLAGSIRAFTIDHMRRIPDGNKLVLGEDYSKYVANEYMKKFDTYAGGEFVLDGSGNKIPEMEIVPVYETIQMSVDNPTYTQIPAVWDDEKQTYTLDISLVDITQFGYDSEENIDWTRVDFKATSPEKSITVNGTQMDYASYLEYYGIMNVTVNKSQEQIDAEKSSYVVFKQLPNGTQMVVKIDGDTGSTPIIVQERPIKQQIKIIKEIEKNEDGSYKDDTYSAVHKDNLSANQYNNWLNKTPDWLSGLVGGNEPNNSTAHVPEFRFKVYLKSNIERLYRDEDGNIVWMDRNGNVLVPEYQDLDGDGNYDTFVWKDYADKVVDFPEIGRQSDQNEIESSNVQKIFTKVEHITDSKTVGEQNNNIWADYNDPQTGSRDHVGEKYAYSTSLFDSEGKAIIINDSLYSYDDKNINVNKTDKINADQNTGYTRILESVALNVSETETVENYNYEKFFDAMHVANLDKWDNDMVAGDTNYPGQNWFDSFEPQFQKEDENTSYKPFQWIREKLFGSTESSASEYPAVHDNDNIENVKNTSVIAHKNAEASNAVRQFAIDWYLKDEVAKLLVNNGYGEDVAKNITIEADGSVTVKEYGGAVDYSEEVYDIALYYAIGKAYNYLKPFFDNDLDTIYSVVIDTDVDGGTDKDNTTLSAATEYNGADKDYYYGVSAYLPYGTYILVEEQPSSIPLGDFDNKHYQTDKPKEISLPMVYAPGSTEEGNAAYQYKTSDTPENMIQKFNIRFNEEWATNHTDDLRGYVIRSHNNNGDFEVFKYGLDVNKITGTIDYTGGSYNYSGFSITQEVYDPLKDNYNSPLVNTIEDGGNANSHYFSDDENGSKETGNGKGYGDNEIEKRYHYASISEHAGIFNGTKTMTGIQTMFDNQYATALVPWSVTEPINSDDYTADNFIGYADSTFRNKFYTTKLRIEKIDSFTGENILHDGAIFGLYAASRYASQAEVDAAIAAGAPATTKIGNVKFYTKETLVTGSYEFLKAMGAENITSIQRIMGDRPNLFTGTVPAGTPVCVESEQIILYDEIGAKTGDMAVYTTTNDVNMVNEDNSDKSYHDQNTGYFVTPQPIGAGVYVLAELKAPAGYSGTKPIAIEVYSDEVTYYLNGDIESRVTATVYTEQK